MTFDQTRGWTIHGPGDPSDPTDSAQVAIYEWCRAWGDADWDGALNWTQKHWLASYGRKLAAEKLDQMFFAFRPVSIIAAPTEVPSGLNPQVARDYRVRLEIAGAGPPVFNMTLYFRVIREDKMDKRPWYKRWPLRFWKWITRKRYIPIPSPSPEGDWGVNPQSVLRGWNRTVTRKQWR